MGQKRRPEVHVQVGAQRGTATRDGGARLGCSPCSPWCEARAGGAAGEARGRTGQSPVSGAFLASANGDVKTSTKCKSGAAGRLGDGGGVHVRAHWSVDAGEVHANSQIAVPLGTGVIDA